MMMVVKRFGRKNRLAKRLIVRIVAFSSLITLVITLFQLFEDYRQQRDDLDDQLEQVAIFLPTITASVWKFDEAQIKLSLEALIHLPHITQATIVTPGAENRWTAHASTPARDLQRSYPLVQTVRNEPQSIATLHITASLDGIYARVLSQAATILISNFIKTFLVAGFIFFIVRNLITRRVDELADEVSTLIPQLQLDNASHREGYPLPEGKGDEISELRLSFNNMAEKLKLAVQDLHD
jgi:methyl-accepting chemotaxis protein